MSIFYEIEFAKYILPYPERARFIRIADKLLNTYQIRRQTDLEYMVNLVNLIHSSLKILPHRDAVLQSTKICRVKSNE